MSEPTPTSHRHTNRLAQESSPYLLQHAHNPVDWYAWGPEAFEAARRENKPIFLSVGYSTCYWCHVMERQSFENEAVAAEMNKRFINIKVDREERPDVDQLYMTAVQVLTRQGGWPMSVFLTPDLRPFYGGTYFPPTDMYGRPGFVTLLRGIEDAYRNRPGDVEKTANQIVQIIGQLAEPSAPELPITIDQNFIDGLMDRSTADYDPRHGGFGGAPKFPRETLLELLLVYLQLADDAGAPPDSNPKISDLKSEISKSKSQISNPKSQISDLKSQIFSTLNALAAGGIRDQLGGGFHRYSTDAQWLVPHFEIMLYDNAMLAGCYAEAYRQTREPRYAAVARGIFDFVLREMTSPAGAFYTAFDAEVDAQEGLSYLWTAPEIEQILGRGDAKLFNQVYGVDRGPNFADPHHGSGVPDKNILFLPQPLEEVAGGLGLSVEALDARLSPMRSKLLAARSRRKQPLLDTKIITSWNALMIRAFAHGGKVLGDETYINAAVKAADFLLHHHRTPNGGLFRTSREGKAKYEGFLDDYAFLAQALLALRDATGADSWKGRAADIATTMLKRFGDTEAGGFYFTDQSAADLIVRQKTATDSPLPSGNAVAAMVLLELGHVAEARQTLAAFAQQMESQGEGMSAMVEAALLLLRRAGPFTVSAAAHAAEDRPLSPQQIAQGVVSIRTSWRGASELLVHLSILRGFHINAHDVGGNAPLIATTLNPTGDDARAAIEYPPGEETSLAFADNPIRVYSGDVTLAVRFPAPRRDGPAVKLAVSYQACDESACLPPTTRQIEATME
ncbi:MAG: thioredoxin domain protein [Phycisphaerales bacterium]|nr:thioredoxin domain protein [Phycisphaerales bacterium]